MLLEASLWPTEMIILICRCGYLGAREGCWSSTTGCIQVGRCRDTIRVWQDCSSLSRWATSKGNIIIPPSYLDFTCENSAFTNQILKHGFLLHSPHRLQCINLWCPRQSLQNRQRGKTYSTVSNYPKEQLVKNLFCRRLTLSGADRAWSSMVLGLVQRQQWTLRILTWPATRTQACARLQTTLSCGASHCNLLR